MWTVQIETLFWAITKRNVLTQNSLIAIIILVNLTVKLSVETDLNLKPHVSNITVCFRVQFDISFYSE